MCPTNDEYALSNNDADKEEQGAASKTFVGKLVSMIGGKLVISNKAGKERSHTLAPNARVTCDGTACSAENLKAGSHIRVTTMNNERKVATAVESLDKNSKFEVHSN